MFNMVVGGTGFKQRTEGKARDLTSPFDQDEKESAERSLGADVFDEPEDMEDALFEINVSHGTSAVEGGPIKNRRGEVSVETQFGEQGLHGWTLDASTLLESEVGRNEAVRDTGEPDVPVGSVGLRTLQIGVAHGVGPLETLREEVVILIFFGSRGSFKVAKTLMGIVAIAMFDSCGDVVLISKLNEVGAEVGSRSEVSFAIDPMPMEDVVQTFGEFKFPPGDVK